MKATNRLMLATILCIFGILLCVFCVGNAASDSMIEEIEDYTNNITIVETFYTTDEDGNNYYYIMWEKDNVSGIIEVENINMQKQCHQKLKYLIIINIYKRKDK